MEFYTERLIMAGYSIRDAVSIVVTFGRKGDFDGLDEFVRIAEAHKDDNHDDLAPLQP